MPHSYNDTPRVRIPLSSSDGNAMGRYLERYIYDAVGNFLEMQHRGSDPANPGWTRAYAYNEASLLEPGKQSNRLTSTTIGATTETYSIGGSGYDPHGNMLHMPQLQAMQWDFKDQLQITQRQAVNATDDEGVQRQGERTWYVYDAGGQRVRKVTELAAGAVKNERIYLGGFEIYRKNGANPLVRETLHMMDDKQRIALVETRTQGNEPGVPAQFIRYQFGNHLGSASLELDDQAQIISYEEYTPYGSSSYQAVRSQTETPRRYRYTGKERDEESGLYYHGARYYAAWVGRWASCDPAGMVDGPNLYQYISSNPIRFSDPTGTQQAAVCTIDPNHPAAVTCTPVSEQPQEPPIEEVTVHGAKRGSKERQAELDAMREKSPGEQETDVENDIDSESRSTESSNAGGEDVGTVGKPGFGESLIPIWGSGREAIYNFQKGNVGWGVFYTALAVSDVFLVKSIVTAGGKLLIKGGATVLAKEGAELATKGGTEAVAKKLVEKEVVEEAAKRTPKLLAAGKPGSVIANKLLKHEVEFAKEIVAHRGGELIGAAKKSAPGIDGFLEGIPISLKQTKGGLVAVLRHASVAEAQAKAAGYTGVEVFIKAENIGATQLLDFALKGALTKIPRQGIVSAINVLTKGGWVRFIP